MTIALELSGWLFGAGGEEGFPSGRSSMSRDDVTANAAVTLGSADAVLVAAVRAGDTIAFERLYKTHARALVISAEGYLGSLQAAEDAVADVFAKLWRARAQWAPQRSVKAYLFGAVRNAALAQLRHAGVEMRGELASAADDPPAMGQPPAAADAVLDLEARMAAVERVLAEFPEARRQIMYMRWQQGMNADEIAAVMGTTRNAVDLQLSRAIRALRTLLPQWVGE